MTASEIVPVDDLPAAVNRAAEKIDAGLPVGLPTDTVYVLAADPTDPGATDRLFTLKQRPRTRDLSVLIASVDDALDLSMSLPRVARDLMEEFWPGPLTLVVPSDPEAQLDLGPDEVTVALRIPDHDVALAVLDETGPLATTLAGVQSEKVYETAQEVAEAYGRWIPLVLDAGRCDGGPVTVVDASGEEPHLIREGILPWSKIQAAIG